MREKNTKSCKIKKENVIYWIVFIGVMPILCMATVLGGWREEKEEIGWERSLSIVGRL